MPGLIDHTKDLRRLAELAGRPAALDDLLSGALDALGALVPYDLASVMELRGDELWVRLTRGPLADERTREHHLALAELPTIRRVLRSQRPLALGAEHHASAEGDAWDGVLDLPHGHACMVVPLQAAGRPMGLMTFDRQVCGVYEEEVVALAGVYGQLVALAMLYAEQSELLGRFRRQLEEENRLLREEAGGAAEACEKLAASRAPAMERLVAQARQVALSEAHVLVRGETGTGKEVLAQAIHSWSARHDGPYVKLNCAAIPDSLIESELFGHVRGAFSGATRDRPGRFLTANGGTLLLDEVGDMPLAAQSKLLRVLQEGIFEPVGSDEARKVDVRVVAATHVDLERAVAEGRFREDLYYRLAVFPLRLPPLRERREDIPEIARQKLDGMARRQGRAGWVLTPEAERALAAAPWPGNIRQLLNAVERAAILSPGGLITEDAVADGPRPAPAPAPPPAPRDDSPLTLEELERRHIEGVLRGTGGKVYGEAGAAALLGLKPSTLQSRMKKLGVARPAG